MMISDDDQKTLIYYIERLQKAERNAHISMMIWAVSTVMTIGTQLYRYFGL